jgi:hypothetical protein
MEIFLPMRKANTDALDVAFETDCPASGQFFMLKM